MSAAARSWAAALERLAPRAAPYVALVGLASAVAVRVEIAGPAGPGSPVAAVWFAAVLAAVALVAQDRDRVAVYQVRAIGVGLGGAAVLCVPAAVRHVTAGLPTLGTDGYSSWAAVVVVVAVAEEALLRGSLFSALERRAGVTVAIAVTSVAFGVMHAPLYGWQVVPLDIAVGVWLGALRAATGTVAAPAIAHALADLAGWWLR